MEGYDGKTCDESELDYNSFGVVDLRCMARARGMYVLDGPKRDDGDSKVELVNRLQVSFKLKS